MPVLVRCVIDGDTWLHDFGERPVSYLSYIHNEQLAAEDTTENRLGLKFGTWCIIKL